MGRLAEAIPVAIVLIASGRAAHGGPMGLENAMVEAAGAGLAADVRHYFELGARVDARVFADDGCVATTALLAAIARGNESILRALLEGGAKANRSVPLANGTFETPLGLVSRKSARGIAGARQLVFC